MNKAVPRSMDGVADGARETSPDAARRSGRASGDWLDEVIAERGQPTPVPADKADYDADMEAIADQMARISATGEVGRSSATGGRDTAEPVQAPRFDARAAIRDAVAEIARRQADLDRHGGVAADQQAVMPADGANPAGPFSGRPAPAASIRTETRTPPPPRGDLLDGAAPWSFPATGVPLGLDKRGPAGPRRSGAGLSSEVSRTFERFSRDLQDAIEATDARPKVEALDLRVRQIGLAVDGLGAGLPAADAIARIGEQTREMRDLLKASQGASIPLDGVERQVASLETRLGRLAALPPVASPSPAIQDVAGTMAEVRAILDGLPQADAITSLETRLDDITDRIERGLEARGPVGLIEGLSRRVDEIHASLRSQLDASAVDTRPLEGLVRGLSDRIGQAREASTDFQNLEVAMRDVATKIDSVTSGINPRGVQALEAQLARLAERLDRSEGSLKALDGVEHSLSELFSQFEVTRQVAIDAAETAARTAARDTLRAALQSPGLAQRPSEIPAGLADRLARNVEDLRTMQDSAERRTQTSLADIKAVMERLALHVAGAGSIEPQRIAVRVPDLADEPRRHRPAPVDDAGMSRIVLDPADMLIEPGSGRVAPGRAEPRLAFEPASEEAVPAPVTSDGDGPASFIAAARRAAQAAQASAAATAVQKMAERKPAQREAVRRGSVRHTPRADAAGALGRARDFLTHRRRPILLSIAALVLLVGALEIVKLGGEPAGPSRAGLSEGAGSERTHLAELPAASLTGSASAAKPVGDPAPVAAAALQPLPSFVAGSVKPQIQLPPDGIGPGLLGLASAGDAGAQYEVGLRFAEGRGVARDPKQALAWFEKAAVQGSAPAEYRLGSAYEKGVGADRDPALAMSWYGKAADAGNIRAMHNLAVMSAEGAAGKPDYAKAAQWFGKASTFGVRDSQFNLAILYARGLGIEQSLAQSYTWFAIAAAQGDDDAAKKRDEVAAKLDPKVLASAKAAADAYRATVPAPAANEVLPPPGGWDAAPRTLGPGSPAGSSAPGAKVSRL